jgi:hypothetical protein
MIEVSETALRDGLTAALGVRRWVAEVAGDAPFASLAELLRVAERAATPLTAREVDEALAQTGSGGAALAGELAAGTASYESAAEQLREVAAQRLTQTFEPLDTLPTGPLDAGGDNA